MHSATSRSCDAPHQAEERPCILLVDDDADVAYTMSSILRQERYVVTIARNAEEALQAVGERTFDVALLEMALAQTDGLGLLADIRSQSPLTCCIILTGYASLETAVAALRQGAYDYIIKPCVIEDLKQILAQAITQQRLKLLAAQREQQLKELNERLEERVQARTAELVEANAAKDRFLATLSHELRTPLSPLRSGIDLLRLRLPGEEWQRILDAMDRNLALETRLISDLLDVARIKAGKLSVEKRPVQVAECLRNSVEMIEPKAAAKQQKLTLHLRDAFPFLLADPVRLQQLVANLLDNAVKFTPHKGQITLSAWLEEGRIAIQVEDSGPGIQPAHLPRVFEPFWQADSSSGRHYGGTGLGLAIAAEIALLHEGELQVANVEEGAGACFTFRFPIVAAEAERADSRSASVPSSLHILLVDDSRDTVEVLSWLLANKGFQVREASTVPQALLAAQADPPDVVITDIGMPGQDGYDLLRSLRADAGLSAIPVIAATGYAGSHEQERMAEAGFAAALSKPFDLTELLDTLARVCPANSSARHQRTAE